MRMFNVYINVFFERSFGARLDLNGIRFGLRDPKIRFDFDSKSQKFDTDYKQSEDSLILHICVYAYIVVIV